MSNVEQLSSSRYRYAFIRRIATKLYDTSFLNVKTGPQMKYCPCRWENCEDTGVCFKKFSQISSFPRYQTAFYTDYLHCISSFQPSSRPSFWKIVFLAWQERYFPASSLSTMSDNVLVVVLPSFEVCGRKKKPFISNTRRKLTT